MSRTSQAIVARLWDYRNLLRDDGMSYGDYLEQLTYLLFLKMAHERTQPPYGEPSRIPTGYDWPALLARDGDDLEAHYRHTLEELARQPGLLGVIFRKAQNRIQDPAKLRRLIVDLIDRETWTVLDADLIVRDKASLDLFWLRDESLEGADALPAPAVLAAGIIEDLQAALEQFNAIADDLPPVGAAIASDAD